MIDKNPITPVTMHGTVRHGADKGVLQASNVGIENQEEIEQDIMTSNSKARAAPLYGEGTIRPDCSKTIETLQDEFDLCLRQRHGFK